MEVNLIAESLKFLVLGMSTVFTFLVLLVLVLNLQAKIIMKYFPAKKENITMGHSSLESSSQGHLAVVAAIAASLQSYKQSK
ncbi:OadG family transporter subunit [Sulfurospirillum barnesii]|uniref:Na+-transporting methylmalonyl-CoA/oxaloacetate decarboxylase, gamma subunit n=1 Tax=Sulfurospirillum barnesii (strain ATCC 700032 / DSM 10660 / SES-3) TaxID=760154 RepID=I3XVJ1_SULBS|nr:OadG family transporter subunit [Sulfurospirillum barnesii]AFL67965.1 Na+-transporting methylmalonyl-CoA/oxaloacetate decarboxylase, gamma subunit [Sulfurospirillum barnesii SES-3]